MKKTFILSAVIASSVLFNLFCKTPEKRSEQIEAKIKDTVQILYELAVINGRVIDPERKFDRDKMNVGIKKGKVEIITEAPLKAKKIIDANGLIVSPGFIDILSYDPIEIGSWSKINDGVSTNLAMHGGAVYPKEWLARFEKSKTPVNFGCSFFYNKARLEIGIGMYSTANAEQRKRLYKTAKDALDNGAMGISFSLEYAPGVNSEEIVPLMKLAAEYGVPAFFHARYSDMEEPGTNFDALNELIEYAKETNAAVHIDHINSTGGTFSMVESLKMLEEVRKEGFDITCCAYPYDFWGTYLSSARFDKGWDKRFRITYKDLQIAGTNERLTEATFNKYRKQGKLAVAYAIPSEDVENALRCSFVMIGSDAILEPGFNNHPRASGTFARTIGYYAREKKIITLMEALEKMTIMPAKRLENIAPDMKRKGRLSVGADADITIFDYNEIIDKSTVENPEIPSAGIKYVIIGGEIVKDPKGLNKKIRNGKPIKSVFNK